MKNKTLLKELDDLNEQLGRFTRSPVKLERIPKVSKRYKRIYEDLVFDKLKWNFRR